jgi:putative addiction module killer protein
MLEVRYYFRDDGRSPFEAWFVDLGVQAAAKVTVALARLERANFSNVKSVGRGVLEYRIDWGPGLRVYFGRDGNHAVILLAGGTKRRQRKDVEAAQAYWADYLRRSRER